MSSLDSVSIEDKGGVAAAAATDDGFTLFPETSDEPVRSEGSHGHGLSGDGKDASQIEAALEALNNPRNSTLSIQYGTPGEKDTDGQALSPGDGRKRIRYFEDHFAYKDGQSASARDRVQKDSPIIAELRTNVIVRIITDSTLELTRLTHQPQVKDEFTLVTDMSYHLSTRFSRPESAIMINIEHSACLLHAGSFEPAYLLTITALPSQMQPTTNKRNAALIQSFMADVLSVPPERGVLRFVPIQEANLASNGATVFGEIERIEKLQADDNNQSSTKRTFTRGSRKSVASPKHQNLKSEPSSGLDESISNISLIASPIPVLSPPKSPVYELSAEEKRRSMNLNNMLKESRPPLTGVLKGGINSPKRHDSKRWSQGHTATPKPPPVPKEKPQMSKISKRKSFLGVFRKSYS